MILLEQGLRHTSRLEKLGIVLVRNELALRAVAQHVIEGPERPRHGVPPRARLGLRRPEDENHAAHFRSGWAPGVFSDIHGDFRHEPGVPSVLHVRHVEPSTGLFGTDGGKHDGGVGPGRLGCVPNHRTPTVPATPLSPNLRPHPGSDPTVSTVSIVTLLLLSEVKVTGCLTPGGSFHGRGLG